MSSSDTRHADGAATRLRRAATIGDLRELARRRLARMVFDYIDGAAGEEGTAARNREALQRACLLPEVLVDVSSRSLACTLFGQELAMPVVVGPTGLNGAAWPRGDLCLARAAAQAGVAFVMSTAATSSLAEVAQAAGPLRWFQLYMLRDRGLAREFLQRVRDHGFHVLELTVDTAVGGRRPRDIRNGFTLPLRWNAANLLDAARHWRWAAGMVRQGTPELKVFAELLGRAARGDTISEVMQQQLSGSFTWNEVAWLREQWSGPLVLKGLSSPEHARRAGALGVDGAVLSNHGGRQLDGAGATIEALPGFVEAARGKLTVLIDSGFRTGTDIAKAIALGADGVQLGRATLYGLAAAGTPGARHALAILAQELELAMALCGARHVGELRGRCLAPDGAGR
ncbi:MAG: alpha-hydroxy-acid oxidizing protein [Betaproteobacteria bacterium]|nr:alpha-hydroxy-acid oxidizing protein [Betaproteobacteria bacterium]MBU6511956.1 alpha-hydroxy-acid oxidizing protein [Betaproteobacteria bacterium]MDE1956851.1 alpha-hydroxy-acid oxidizing protein [Betaproteobacteria bacterium]MDE2152186.1 alpha-hydroxy-acid oxidizing protein [Betaproteobacteria bacterium]MDE2477272.1 alpha-hydroxy-acid oxidizing protein [Betaproteobacteria bacterium]